MPGNVYYDPGSYGMTLLGSLDEDGLSYEYNTLIVLKHDETGRIYYALDSGCSCPTPFEHYDFRGPDDNDLTEIKLGESLTSFERDVESFPASQHERGLLIDQVRPLVRPVPVPAIGTSTSTVAQLFRAFSEGDFETLLPLADALDESGLPNYAEVCREGYEKRVGIAMMTRRLVALKPAFQESFPTISPKPD